MKNIWYKMEGKINKINVWFRINEFRSYKYLLKQWWCNHIYARSRTWYKPSKQNPNLGVWGETYCCRGCGKVITIPLYYAFEKEKKNEQK